MINVSGHRIGTAEIENVISMHPDVVESAIVGYSHGIKGQGIHAFVITTNTKKDSAILKQEITTEVTKGI